MNNDHYDFKTTFPPPETKREPVKAPAARPKGIESFEVQRRHAESNKLPALPSGPDWED